jgi:hypothetical protein
MASPTKVSGSNNDFLAVCFQSLKGGKPAVDYDRLAILSGLSKGTVQ